MLNSLPRLTRDEASITNLIANCSSMAAKAKAWLPGIEELLSQLVGTPCKIEFKRFSVESKSDITGSVFSITWPPAAGNAWIECDTKTLQTCAYKAISQTVTTDNLDPKLSNLESGIVLFLLRRSLEGTKESFQITESQELLSKALLCLSFDFKLGDLNSYLRLWISPEMLTPDVSESASQTGKQRSMSAEFPLHFELGKVDLTQEELNGLEAGDIVILENSSLETVQAVLGDPVCAILKGSMTTNETTGNYSFSIQELS